MKDRVNHVQQGRQIHFLPWALPRRLWTTPADPTPVESYWSFQCEVKVAVRTIFLVLGRSFTT
jgi:hypothetical protein